MGKYQQANEEKKEQIRKQSQEDSWDLSVLKKQINISWV